MKCPETQTNHHQSLRSHAVRFGTRVSCSQLTQNFISAKQVPQFDSHMRRVQHQFVVFKHQVHFAVIQFGQVVTCRIFCFNIICKRVKIIVTSVRLSLRLGYPEFILLHIISSPLGVTHSKAFRSYVFNALSLPQCVWRRMVG
jgi:hypothetical protein